MKLTLTLIITSVFFVDDADIPPGMALVPTNNDHIVVWITFFYGRAYFHTDCVTL